MKIVKKVILKKKIFEEKRQEPLEKNLVANVLESLRVKKAMMQTVKPVEYKLFSIFKDK